MLLNLSNYSKTIVNTKGVKSTIITSSQFLKCTSCDFKNLEQRNKKFLNGSKCTFKDFEQLQQSSKIFVKSMGSRFVHFDRTKMKESLPPKTLKRFLNWTFCPFKNLELLNGVCRL